MTVGLRDSYNRNVEKVKMLKIVSIDFSPLCSTKNGQKMQKMRYSLTETCKNEPANPHGWLVSEGQGRNESSPSKGIDTEKNSDNRQNFKIVEMRVPRVRGLAKEGKF